jgi:2-hydroxychromene-2-carboxylate isomerase
VADLEFFFDPVCPWAYLTSRWVVEVQRERPYDVTWRFISLRMINAAKVGDPAHAWYTEDYQAIHRAGTHGLRVADEIRLQYGPSKVGDFYTALGQAIHRDRRRDEIIGDPVAMLSGVVESVGLPGGLGAHALDESHDEWIASETELAFSRTGRDVGTPIMTFNPGQPNEGSFFGPVINRVPRGDEAVRLWEAVATVATTPGVAELKRSIRGEIDFS